MKSALIGIDIAKNVFQACALNRAGKVMLNEAVQRPKLLHLIRQDCLANKDFIVGTASTCTPKAAHALQIKPDRPTCAVVGQVQRNNAERTLTTGTGIVTPASNQRRRLIHAVTAAQAGLIIVTDPRSALKVGLFIPVGYPLGRIADHIVVGPVIWLPAVGAFPCCRSVPQ